MTIELPPLRERASDIRDLAMHFMARQCERYCIGTKGLSAEFLDVLGKYDWPGNVRELVHAMESSLIAAGTEPVLYPDHLPVHIRVHVARNSVAPVSEITRWTEIRIHLSGDLPKIHDVRETTIAEVERRYLQRLLSLTGTDTAETCRIAGLSRSQLYALLKKHGISRQGAMNYPP